MRRATTWCQLVIRQFAEGQDVGCQGFVMRNRTMTLLSDATVLVQLLVAERHVLG